MFTELWRPGALQLLSGDALSSACSLDDNGFGFGTSSTQVTSRCPYRTLVTSKESRELPLGAVCSASVGTP